MFNLYTILSLSICYSLKCLTTLPFHTKHKWLTKYCKTKNKKDIFKQINERDICLEDGQ